MNKKSGTDSISIDPRTKKVKRQSRRRVFRQVWLENPAFKCWLQEVQDDPYKGKCTICCKHITAIKSNLLHHANSQEHIMNMEYVKEPPTIKDEPTSTNVASDSSMEYGNEPLTIKDEPISTNVASDSSSDSNSIGPPAKKVKRPSRKQQFRQAWLEEPAFKCWLQQVQDNPFKAKCTICCKYITAIKCNLLHHGNSKEHTKNMKYGKGSLTSRGETTKNFSDEMKVAEIRVCIDAIENNRSFHSFIHFMRMLQETLPDQHLLKHMSLNPKKMTAITKNVINKSIIKKTIETVQGKFFSILIDEIADISDMKMVFFLLRYVHNGQICTDLLDLIRIKECTAETLYQCFRYSLNKYNLFMTNMVGVCVDKANGMVGAHNSLTSRLLADNEEICILPCICHSIHLAARKTCECLPRYVDKFLHSLYSYFSRNPEQLSMLDGTQQCMKIAKRKVTQPSPTKWLARSECIKRVLNQWTVLLSVFAEISSEKHADVAKRIFSSLKCLYTKAYLQFMDYILVIFTELNKLLQSSKVLVHRLLPECYRLLKTLGGNFIQSKYLKQPNIHKINVDNEDKLLPLTKIFTGAGCMATLSEIANGNLEENGDIIQFYTNVRKCYQSAFQNIVDTVPFDDTFLNALDFLNPQTALDKHEDGQLDCILNKFKSKFDYELVVNEWHLLPFTFSEKSIEKLQVMSLPQFWHEMSITTNAEDEYILPNISKLAQLCLSLPHSNADVERYFSTVTQIKTSDRNRLNPETVAAIARIKLDLKNKNENWHDYKITDDMLNLFDNSMYNKEKIPKELIGILMPDEMNETTSDSDND